MGNLIVCCRDSVQEMPNVGQRRKQQIRKDSEYAETSVIRYKNTQISVLRGDITEEGVDAIVNVQNKYLNLNTMLSLKLSQQGGDEYTEEIKNYKNKEGEMKVGSVIYTHSGQLNCDYILHTCLPQYEQSIEIEADLIYNIVKQCLNLCKNELNLNSIAFPALQNGQMALGTTKTAIATFEAIKQYLEQEPKNTLNQIYLVLQDSKACVSFQKALFIVFGERNEQSDLFKSAVSEDLMQMYESVSGGDRDKIFDHHYNKQKNNSNVKQRRTSQKSSF